MRMRLFPGRSSGKDFARWPGSSRAGMRSSRLPHLRPHIHNDIMRPGLFPACRFDRICLFQVMDHIPEPTEFLAECFRVLRREGWFSP